MGEYISSYKNKLCLKNMTVYEQKFKLENEGEFQRFMFCMARCIFNWGIKLSQQGSCESSSVNLTKLIDMLPYHYEQPN